MKNDLVYRLNDQTIYVREGIRIPKSYTEEENKTYVYLLKIETNEKFSPYPVIHKVGTTCSIMHRMKALLYNYQCKSITILWISPAYSTSTALRVETNFRTNINQEEWIAIPKDRFILPDNVKEITIKVRNEYTIKV